MPMTDSSVTGSYPEADGAGSVARIDLSLSAMEDANHKTDAVALQPIGAGGWSAAPDDLGQAV